MTTTIMMLMTMMMIKIIQVPDYIDKKEKERNHSNWQLLWRTDGTMSAMLHLFFGGFLFIYRVLLIL